MLLDKLFIEKWVPIVIFFAWSFFVDSKGEIGIRLDSEVSPDGLGGVVFGCGRFVLFEGVAWRVV